jgi:hypothetical protein
LPLIEVPGVIKKQEEMPPRNPKRDLESSTSELGTILAFWKNWMWRTDFTTTRPLGSFIGLLQMLAC